MTIVRRYKKIRFLLLLAFLQVAVHKTSQAQFTPGNIVVYRIGPSPGNTYKKVFLDEYTPTGVLVQSVQMPIANNGSNLSFTMVTNADLGAGALSLSPDGKYLTATGYGEAEGGSSCGCSRAIAIVDYNANVNTSSRLPIIPGHPGPAVTSNGTDIWGGTSTNISSGIRAGTVQYSTLGSSSSINLAGNFITNAMNIVSGQLYVSSNGFGAANGEPGFIATLGSGLPTAAGQTITKLPGLPDDIRPNQFVLADMNPAIPGVDVLYFANGGRAIISTPQTGGIHKYSLVGGTWVFNGSVGTSDDNARGLAAKITGTTITLFATRRVASNGSGGELVSLMDNSGYNGSFTAVPTVLVTAAAGTAFKGVALAPSQPVCSSLSGLHVSNITGNSANMSWNADAGSTSYQYVLSTSVNPPASGTDTTATNFNANGLSTVTTYYVHVRNHCGNLFSPWLTTSFKTSCPVPAPTIVTVNFHAGTAEIRWNKVNDVTSYEYAVLKHQASPLAGSTRITTDTSLYIPQLIAGGKYFFHIRGHCASKGVSPWVVFEFHTSGIEVYPNPTRDKVRINLFGANNTNRSIFISDAMGRIVRKIRLNANTVEVDMNGLAAGLYWVKYEDYEGYVTKFIKL